jgi:uncharacterized Zn-binding protein involved in type VI secretion
MPGVARCDIDAASQHMIISGSIDTYINNQKAVHEGSVTATGLTVTQGSTTVYVNDKPLAREADIIADGQSISSSSTTVFANS